MKVQTHDASAIPQLNNVCYTQYGLEGTPLLGTASYGIWRFGNFLVILFQRHL